MLVLIEGSDGLGKTTLAKALQWKMGCAYVHHAPPKEWERDQFLRVLDNAVYDRFHWSMWAYKNVRQQPLNLTLDHCRAIDERLAIQQDGDYFTVVLYSSDPAYFEKMPSDHLFSLEQIQSVNARYELAKEYFGAQIDVATSGYPTAEQILDLIGF